MKLSIITPYYKTLEYIIKLAEILEPQLRDDTEWIIIDDGCNEKALDKLKAKVIHLEKNSGTASKPRNAGLDVATGEYIAFIDSDDIVIHNYVDKILSKTKKQPDIIYLSWKSKIHNIIANNKLPKWNCAVWCRVYKRELIGSIRFNESLRKAEDWLFNQEIKPKSQLSIKEQIYIYNNGRKGSICNMEVIKCHGNQKNKEHGDIVLKV